MSFWTAPCHGFSAAAWEARTAEDVYGRYYDFNIDKKGNLVTPMYKGGMITGPSDWEAWDKRGIYDLPGRANAAFSRIQKDFGDKIFIMGSFLYGLFENSWQPLGFDRFSLAVLHPHLVYPRLRHLELGHPWDGGCRLGPLCLVFSAGCF